MATGMTTARKLQSIKGSMFDLLARIDAKNYLTAVMSSDAALNITWL